MRHETFPLPMARAQIVPILTAIGSILFLGIFTIAVYLRGHAELALYLRDPAATFHHSPFAGLISNIGILALVVTGTSCLLAAHAGLLDRGLLRAIGLFSLFLALDDLLMLHEVVLPRIGISETMVFLIYGVVALVIGWRYRDELRLDEPSGLHLAIALLASSVVADKLLEMNEVEVLAEDGLKFVGLLTWSAYWIGEAIRSIKAR